MANDCQVQVGELPYNSGNMLREGVDTEYEPGKLFVGGLSYETKEESLRAYFEKFGELSEVRVMISPAPEKKPRGFGFVTYLDPKDAENALAEPIHNLDGAKVEAKKATKSGVNPPSSGSKGGTKKVFLGGLPPEATDESIRCGLMDCGPIAETEIKIDQATERSRGFGFATFVTEEGAAKAVAKHFVPVDGKQVEVKFAENQKKAVRGGLRQGYGRQDASMYYSPYGQQPQAHAGYGYDSGHSGAYQSYPQWQGYGSQYQGASAGYYQGSSGTATYPSGYGNSYSTPRTDSTGASYSAPQAQSYSYPQQQQQQQSYPSYQGYSGGGGAAHSQMPQQGYNSSFPPRQ